MFFVFRVVLVDIVEEKCQLPINFWKQLYVSVHFIPTDLGRGEVVKDLFPVIEEVMRVEQFWLLEIPILHQEYRVKLEFQSKILLNLPYLLLAAHMQQPDPSTIHIGSICQFLEQCAHVLVNEVDKASIHKHYDILFIFDLFVQLNAEWFHVLLWVQTEFGCLDSRIMVQLVAAHAEENQGNLRAFDYSGCPPERQPTKSTKSIAKIVHLYNNHRLSIRISAAISGSNSCSSSLVNGTDSFSDFSENMFWLLRASFSFFLSCSDDNTRDFVEFLKLNSTMDPTVLSTALGILFNLNVG